jgi:uncharacterized membrane protein YadS
MIMTIVAVIALCAICSTAQTRAVGREAAKPFGRICLVFVAVVWAAVAFLPSP